MLQLEIFIYRFDTLLHFSIIRTTENQTEYHISNIFDKICVNKMFFNIL